MAFAGEEERIEERMKNVISLLYDFYNVSRHSSDL